MCCSVLTPLYGREVAACLNDPNITLRFFWSRQHGEKISKTGNKHGGMQEWHDKLRLGRFFKVQQVN